jgi:7-cyano-7-deazaguanine tRNA-ribosyltransferase|tara:strand:- start:5949 stop:7862 length:1914 start_codon:yes stop_codon:yes gene_type:complete
MFEIKERDAMGRIGLLKARNKVIETPVLLPVVNPNLQEITPEYIKGIGYEGLITNSYIIHQSKKLRKNALENGIHKMLGFDGLLMTDSGSYQLYCYGDVDVDPIEIVKFQNAIGSDIGVILDIPTPTNVDHSRVNADLLETLKRAKESSTLSFEMLLAGTIQGGVFLDLRAKSAKEMGNMGFDIYPIGGVVPLLDNYRFNDLVKVVMECKKHLPLNKPVHLFGCGHPMMFALACAMGCDILDSAAYSLFAQNGRYITSSGTLRLPEIRDFPCSCKICSSYTPKELNQSENQKETLLAKHNLNVSLEEIKMVKQCIHDGSLLELVERRVRGHPYLLNSLRSFFLSPLLEKFDPLTKRSAFFYSGSESILRPEITRHISRLNRLRTENRTLVILPENRKPYSKFIGIKGSKEYQVTMLSKVFGIIPIEIEDIYPLNQHVAPRYTSFNQDELMINTAKKFLLNFSKTLIHHSLKYLKLDGNYFKNFFEIGVKEDIISKAISMADYQFGKGSGNILFKDVKIEISKTNRIRRAIHQKHIIAAFRASDGFIIPSIKGARRILELPFPNNRVIVSKEAEDFVEEGKSVFSKFIISCDPTIRPYQEVIVVNDNDKLLGTGKAILTGLEMLSFNRGVAVKTRHHV